MKKPGKVHILFERSGTFLRAFEKFGIPAVDYDVEAEHDGVRKVDIFKEIGTQLWGGEPNIFNEMSPGELVFAFFPCTYFSDQSQLLSRGDGFGQKEWTLDVKILRSQTDMLERERYFDKLCRLVRIALKKNLPLIIENPYGKVNFLKWYFPVKPALVIKDRRLWGDTLKKPTQFFFINCEPEFCLMPVSAGSRTGKPLKKVRGFERSRISGAFAENFIENVLKDKSWETAEKGGE